MIKIAEDSYHFVVLIIDMKNKIYIFLDPTGNQEIPKQLTDLIESLQKLKIAKCKLKKIKQIATTQ